MVKKYQLNTIADIFEKVPSDRIKDCCDEIGTLLSSTKCTGEALLAATKEMGHPVPNQPLHKIFALSFPITWIDDKKGKIETRFREAGSKKPIFTIKVTKGQKPNPVNPVNPVPTPAPVPPV